MTMKTIERLLGVVDKGLFNRFSTLGYDRTIEAIVRLSSEVNDCDDDVEWHVGEGGSCTLDSLLVGAYWYCVDYHGGQWSAEYALQCNIGGYFDPGMSSLEKDSSEFDAYVALAVLAGHGEWEEIADGFDCEECDD
jgi:hypothetical protein